MFLLQVEYQCAGFLEKNRDTVYEEQINILKASQVRRTHVRFKRVFTFTEEVVMFVSKRQKNFTELVGEV